MQFVEIAQREIERQVGEIRQDNTRLQAENDKLRARNRLLEQQLQEFRGLPRETHFDANGVALLGADVQ